MRVVKCCKSQTLLSLFWEIPILPSSESQEALRPRAPRLTPPLPSWQWWTTKGARQAVSTAKWAATTAACTDRVTAGTFLLFKILWKIGQASASRTFGHHIAKTRSSANIYLLWLHLFSLLVSGLEREKNTLVFSESTLVFMNYTAWMCSVLVFPQRQCDLCYIISVHGKTDLT